MTVITWDSIEDRQYQTGIERGVLFPLEGPGVPWNGLTEVQENVSRQLKSYYLDGIKFLDHFVPGSYSARLSAITYPSELDTILGISEFAPGVFVHDQPVGMFHLSYRTLLGDPLQGHDLGYKLHLIYNLTANPRDTSFQSLSDSPSLSTFDWDLSGVQTTMWGIRPSNHLSFDSRTTDSEILDYVEDILYGTELTDPEMPDFVSLLTTIEEMAA